MAFLAFIATLVATTSGSDLVLLFAGLGGLSGLAALVSVWTRHRVDSKRAKVDDKSVAITELEKAVPGMGEIIREWQNIVHQLQSDLTLTRTELADCRKRVVELESQNVA